jgi:predicted amidohydrolase YtcJ
MAGQTMNETVRFMMTRSSGPHLLGKGRPLSREPRARLGGPFSTRALILRKLALVAIAVAGCADRARPVADAVFTGSFLTLDPAHPRASAMAVADGRILAIGDDSDVAPFLSEGTKRIALPGTALPGLADAHVHVAGLGEQLDQIDLHGLQKREVVARVAERAAELPEGEWILGSGWDEGHWTPSGFPEAADLDAAAPRHPVILDRIDGHSIWVNSRALAMAEVTRDTADPEGGRIHRDAGGSPTGIFVDHANALVRRVVPAPTSEQAERRLRSALEQYVRWGLTSVHDAGADLETVALYKKLLAEEALPLRLYVMAQGTGGTAAATLSRGPEVGLGDGRLTIRSFKVVLDGALGSRGAELFEPYADAPKESGLETMSDASFRELIEAARVKGFQVNAHAIGDRAVRRALDAFEAAGPEARRLRFRVEHASVVAPADRSRFRELEVIASMQPVFVGEYGRWAGDRVGAGRTPSVLAIRSLADAGARVALGTDYPASDSGDPIENLYCAVTRNSPGGTGATFLADERLDVESALAGLTAGPAFAAFQEEDLGSLTVGRYADMTVLSEDPLSIPAERIRELEVVMTIVGGRVVFQR